MKAKYVCDEREDSLFGYYGLCPECGNEGIPTWIFENEWNYCETHKTCWCSGSSGRDPYDPKLDDERIKFFKDGNYEVVDVINSKLETNKNKAAMLEEMKVRPVTQYSEILFVDNVAKHKNVYSLQPLLEACQVEIRFDQSYSKGEKLKILLRVVNQLIWQKKIWIHHIRFPRFHLKRNRLPF